MAVTLGKSSSQITLAASAAVAAFVLAALAPAAALAAEPTCAATLLADWQDGRIDGTYPAVCYREALGALPEDVRAYSTAEADITRALRATLRRNVTRAPSAHLGSAPAQPSRRRASGAHAAKPNSAARTSAERTRALEPASASTLLRSPPLPLLMAAALALALGLAGLVVQRLRVRRHARERIVRRQPHPIR